MADTLPGPSSVIDDDDYDEEYDEPNGGNSLLGFMFGNVDNSGDLDADYLDKDAKEHLFALVDQLGPSLTEIELSKASPATMDTSEQGRLQTSRPLVHVLRKLQQTINLIIGHKLQCVLSKDRENLEWLEIAGVGDPSGRGLGFSYVRVAPKAPISNANLKKKAITAKNTTVTGTDADLRRLSMEAAREVCVGEQILPPWDAMNNLYQYGVECIRQCWIQAKCYQLDCYFDIVQHPMDLSTIREKVRKLEYKDHEDFRHDVWQITVNAHLYSDGRNPGIPPLANQFLELCDHLLEQYSDELYEAEAEAEAEAGI